MEFDSGVGPTEEDLKNDDWSKSNEIIEIKRINKPQIYQTFTNINPLHKIPNSWAVSKQFMCV